MINLSNKKIWIAALAMSLFLHGILIFCIPALPKKKEKTAVMAVRIAAVTESIKEPTPIKEPEVKKGAFEQKIIEAPSESRLEVEPEPRPEPKPEPEPEPKPIPEPKAEPKIEPKAEVKPKLESKSKPKAKPPADEKPTISTKPEGPKLPKTPTETTQSTEVTDLSAKSLQAPASYEPPAVDFTESQETEPDNVPVDASTLKITKKVLPEYSSFSRKRREEGTVKVIITIENGKVTGAEIEESSSYSRLDESALRAVKQWTFEYNGRIKARLPIVFKLQ